MRTRTGLLASVFVAASIASSPAAAQFEPVLLDVPHVRQDTIAWCWMAVAEMVLRYKGIEMPRQCQVMEIGYRAPPGSCCANMNACTRVGHIVEIQGIVQQYGGGLSRIVPPADPVTLAQVFRRGDPVIAHLQLPTGGHFVVLRGLRWVPSQFGPVPVVVVNDPMQYQPIEIPFANVASAWDAGVLISGNLRKKKIEMDEESEEEDETSRWRFEYWLGDSKRTSGGSLDKAGCEAERESKRSYASRVGPCKTSLGGSEEEEETSREDAEQRRADCEDRCEKAVERCEREAERAKNQCMREFRSGECGACRCPNWPPGNFYCYDVCTDCAEDTAECLEDAEDKLSRCEDQRDSCEDRCR